MVARGRAETSNNPLWDVYNDYRKDLYDQQVRDCKEARAAGQ